jgi:N-hydroxyarylamine O-acetyltransferase
LETLRALHVLHPDAIAFEAIDVLLDRGVDLSPEAVDTKLIGARRGGYCFEHNSLFKRVLEAIGFKVQGLGARVTWGKQAGASVSPRTHMALRVTIEGTPWLSDVGFGSCVLTSPLRMDTSEPQQTQHEAFRIFPYGPSQLLQIRRDDRWLPVFELTPESQFEPDYELSNWFTATHPASPFRQHLSAARTTPEARYALLDNRFTIRRADGATERQTLDARQIERMLTDVFRLPVAADWHPVIERAATVAA